MRTETEIVRLVSPQEEELASKRRELTELLTELSERELSLASLKAELLAFEGQYLREVGVLYAELDDWNAKIAELTADREGTSEAQAAAREARKQADETYGAAHGEASKAANFIASPELKKLFKEVLKRVHPDRAAGEADRTLRERLMKEANAAYARGEENTLRKVLQEYERSPESVTGVGMAAELERTVRQIEHIRRRLTELDQDISSLKGSPVAKLIAKSDQLRSEGRNLFAEMSADTKRRIDVARNQFEILVAGSKTV